MRLRALPRVFTAKCDLLLNVIKFQRFFWYFCFWQSIWEVLHNLAPFTEFIKKWKKKQHEGVIILKVTLLHRCFHAYQIVQIVPNCGKRLILGWRHKRYHEFIRLKFNSSTDSFSKKKLFAGYRTWETSGNSLRNNLKTIIEINN